MFSSRNPIFLLLQKLSESVSIEKNNRKEYYSSAYGSQCVILSNHIEQLRMFLSNNKTLPFKFQEVFTFHRQFFWKVLKFSIYLQLHLCQNYVSISFPVLSNWIFTCSLETYIKGVITTVRFLNIFQRAFSKMIIK